MCYNELEKRRANMEIKIVSDVRNTECDVIVAGMYEGEKTAHEIANTYAI